MAQSDLNRLIGDLRADSGLASRILAGDDIEAAVSRARDAGYDVNLEECRSAVSGMSSTGELSDSDLAQVAGGGSKQGDQGLVSSGTGGTAVGHTTSSGTTSSSSTSSGGVTSTGSVSSDPAKPSGT